MRRALLSFLLVTMVVTSGVSFSMATNAADAFSPQDYVVYLTECGKQNQEALEVRDQFLKLSEEDQQEFVRYMCNPNIVEETLTTSVRENSTKELHNGDIVVEHTNQIEVVNESQPQEKRSALSSLTGLFISSCFAAPPIRTIKLTDVRNVTVKDIKVSTFTCWVLYKAQGNVVKSVIDGNGQFSNWWHVTVEKDYVSKYVHGNKAQTCIVWNVGPFIIGKFNLGFLRKNLHHDVIGNAQGGKSYRFYSESTF